MVPTLHLAGETRSSSSWRDQARAMQRESTRVAHIILTAGIATLLWRFWLVFDWVRGPDGLPQAEQMTPWAALSTITCAAAAIVYYRAATAWRGQALATGEANSVLKSQIKQQEKVEMRLQELKKEAELASGAKSEFLANMSHELRTPLNAIIGFSEVLRDEHFGTLNEKQSEYTQDILQSGKHLLALINDILDLAKVEAGKVELTLSTLALTHTVDTCVDLVRERARTSGIAIHTNFSDEIPDIQADERRIKQVLFNILSNAIKFTPPGGQIGVEVRMENDCVLVTVWDTGIGIDGDDRDKVFEEFQQIDHDYSREYAGTGLGMPLSRRLVEMHGGKMWLISDGANRGTRFMFTLPVTARPHLNPPVQEASAAEDLPPTVSRNGLKVLVIEDDIRSAKLLRSVLSEVGFSVKHVSNGLDVIDEVKALQPDVITLDVLLPGRYGWDILADLKSDPATASIPVIVITVVDDGNRAVVLGADEFVVKPISKAVLFDCLSNVGVYDKGTILVIDDDAKALKVICAMLEPQGFKVITSQSAREGIKLAQAKAPRVIILDLNMPEMSGFDTLSILRKEASTCDIPIMIMTSQDIGDNETQLLNRHAEAIVFKSQYDKAAFVNEINRVSLRTDITRRAKT